MKSRGILFAIIGLLVGITIGGCIQLERYLARSLLGLLADEVKTSVGCNLVYDHADISLISLHGYAKHPRVICGDSVDFEFSDIEAQFSLTSIMSKVVRLTDLQLHNGLVRGVSPKSTAYKFVDYLSAPIPPEKDRPGRWKLKLEHLTVDKSSFVEELGKNALIGSDVSLDLSYDQKNDAILRPKVGSLQYLIRQKGSVAPTAILPLGKATSSITISEDATVFNPLLVTDSENISKLTATAEKAKGNTLTGEGSHTLSAKYLGLPDWILAEFDAATTVTGNLESPILSGTLQQIPHAENKIQFGDILVANLSNLSGVYKVDVNHGEPIVTISSLESADEHGSLTLTEPLVLDGDKLSGSFAASIETVNVEGTLFKNLDLSIDISGVLDDLTTIIRGQIGELESFPFRFKEIESSAKIHDNTIDFKGIKAWLDVRGLIDITPDGLVIKESAFKTTAAPASEVFSFVEPDTFLGEVQIAGSGKAQGPFNLKKINVTSTYNLTHPDWDQSVLLPGNATVHNGKAEIDLISEDKALNLKSVLVLDGSETQSKVSVDLKDLKLVSYNAKDDCSHITGNLTYSFDQPSPRTGSGALVLNAVELGCKPHTISLDSHLSIPITNGKVQLKELKLHSLQSAIELSGGVSLTDGYSLKTSGEIPLKAFAPYVPTFDELRGFAQTNISMNGSLSEPKITGSIYLKDGEVYIESAGLAVSDLTGKMTFNDSKITVDAVQGTANGGIVLLSGSIFPFDFRQSQLLISFQETGLEATKDLSVVTDGALALRPTDSGLLIDGTVSIQSAQYEKDLSIFTIARKLGDFLFKVRSVNPLASLAPYNLNINVIAKRNIFILTDFTSSELKADLHLGGTLNAPDITGTMDVLSGWLGLHDRKFDITSGTLIFPGGLSLPNIALIGETSVRSKNADTVTVYLDAKGPLLGPQVDLTSDSGLPQRELLALLTTRSQRLETTSVNARTLSRGNGGYSLTEDVPLLSYSRFFRALTRLDSISIEPEYNYQSGAIEPVVTARKNITDDLYLIGEGYLGTQTTESRAGIVYDLLPYLTVAGYVANTSDKKNLALEADATVTLLAAQKKFVRFDVDGNNEFSQSEILKAVRLTTTSRIPYEDFKPVLNSVKRFYYSKGYFEAEVKGRCSHDGELCRNIKIVVSEGLRFRIEEIVFQQETLPTDVSVRSIPEISDHPFATNAFLKKSEQLLLRGLRSEGYISARVKVSYEKTQHQRVNLSVALFAGKPVTFTFVGNSVFTPEELLSSIDLFGRKTPFGINTINILAQNIAQKYEEEGYLFATVQTREETDESSPRTQYVIEINEEKRAPVTSVHFVGLEKLSENTLRKKLREYGQNRADALLSPKYAIADELEEQTGFLTEAINQLGFPEVAVDYKVEPSETGDEVFIAYTISEGRQFTERKLHFVDLPKDIVLTTTDKVISPTEANTALDAVLSDLKSQGFVSASLSSSELSDNSLEYIIEPGQRTIIQNISIEGLAGIDEQVIRDAFKVNEGSAWNEEAINTGKQRILKLGLVSRVDIRSEDGALDSPHENLVIRVTEKPLQSLELGGGYNTEFGVHLFGEGVDRSLFADGKALIMRLDAYTNSATGETISKGIASVKYLDPSLFGGDYTLTEDLRYQKFNSSTQEFDLDRTSIASYIYRAWESGLSFSTGHTAFNENITSVPNDVILSDLDSGNVFIGFLSGVASFDKRDNPLNPREGYDISADYKVSSPAFGSEASFYNLGGKISGLLPFTIGNSQFTFAAAVRGGSGWVFGNTDDIPISQRYYLGGRNTVRGYKENTLGPRGRDGNTIGGDSSILGTTELQYHPTEETAVLMFLDSGNVYLKGFDEENTGAPLDQIDEDRDLLRYSSGLGFRYLSPIGPIGLDVGFPINGRETDSAFRVHFTIGSNF